MTRFRDIPIQSKLRLVILVSSATALLLSGLAVLWTGSHFFRSEIMRDMTALAELLATNTSDALAFDDPAPAQRNLNALATNPEIVSAWIYDRKGQVVAEYVRESSRASPAPPLPLKNRTWMRNDEMVATSEIWFGSQPELVGSLCLISDLKGQTDRFYAAANAVLLALFVSILVALLISRQLQQLLTDPILSLTKVAHAVTLRRDYGLRAQKFGNDEIGFLTETMNEMLAQIEQSDATLRNANSQLEKEVRERTAAEESLRKSHRFIAGITDGSPNVLYLHDLHRQRPVYVNSQIQSVLGFQTSQQDLEGSPFLKKYTHPDDLADVDDYLRRLDASKQGDVVEREFRVKNKEGQWRWLNSHDTVYQRDDNGVPTQVLGTIIDITERRDAENRLRDAEARLRFLIENVPAITYSADFGAKGKWRYVSPQLEHILGFTPEEWIADPDLWPRQIHPDDRTIALDADQQCQKTGAYRAEYRIVSKDKRVVWCRDEGRVVNDRDGHPLHLQGIILDITSQKAAELALVESEQRFRQLAENIREVFWMTDPKKQVMLYISPAYEAIWQRTRESLYANPRNWIDAIHPDDRERIVAKLPDQPSGHYDVEYRIVQPDGNIRWIRDRAFPVRDAHNLVYRIAGIAEDITERKRIETALRESEERYRHLVETATDTIYTIAPDSIITSLNASFENFLGWKREQWLQKPFTDIVHPDDRAHAVAIFQQVITGDVPPVHEVRVRSADGQYRVAEITASPQMDGDRVVGYLGIARDITERKKIEAALRDAEEKWRSLVQNSPDYILIVDARGVISYINRAGSSVPVESVIGTSVFDRLPEDTREAAAGILADLFQRGNSSIHETSLPSASGATVYYECRLVPIKNDGRVVSALMIATDITDRKRLEREILEISDREQQRIGQDLHDDLCQRLAAIAFASSALESGLHDRAPAQSTQAREITTMTTDTISLARILARGLYPVQLEREGLRHALDELARTVTDRYHVPCHFQQDEGVVLDNHTAALYLFRIAQEAVSNAIRHAQPREIHLGLRRDRNRIILTVRDDGIGMQRGTPNSAGMGLSIMKYRARVIGAQFLAKSNDHGTTITCSYMPESQSTEPDLTNDGGQEE